MKKEIEVFRDGDKTFWKKKGDMCSSRDIIELVKLVNNGWKLKQKQESR